MSYLSARRSPFPYHFKIGDTGLLLGVSGPNQPMLASSKAQDISQVTPPDFSYAGMSPLGDRDEPYESLVLGMGLKTQEQWADRRYYYAQGVDLSVWPWCKGPEIPTVMPATVDVTAYDFFFELGGVLYCIQGRYVLRRDSDTTWTMVKDFGVGASVLNVAVFTSNFDGVQRAWVALAGGPAQYSSNGTTWTPMATFGALAFAAVGREWWWADDTNRLRKCDTNADPTLEANYTSLIFRAGDKSSPITALMISAAGTLIIAKTDGLYTLDQAGDDHQLFPFLRFGTHAGNGKAWGQFENDLYTAYANNLIKIGPDLSATEVGPEKLVNNDSPVHGPVSAFVPVGTMYALVGMHNQDTNTGHLMKFGGYVEKDGQTEHLDAWHGSLGVPFTGFIVHMYVSGIGAPAGHTRTWLVFRDGRIGYLVNPCVPHPAACSQYRFHVGDGFVDLPLWHGGYHASPKSIRHFSVTGPRLDATNYVTIDYKLEPSAASWTAFPNVFDHSTYESAMLPVDATTVLAAFRVHLVNTSNTTSPLVSAVSIGHALRPSRYMQVELRILCADGLVRRDGVPLRIGRRQIQRIVEAAVDSAGAVRCTLPDETVQELSFTDYSVSQSFDEVGRQWRGTLTVKAIQHHSVTTEV